MTALPNPFDPNPEVGIPTTNPAAVDAGVADQAAVPENQPQGTAAASRFRLNVQAFTYAIDQRSVDWDPLPKFIADPSPEYLEIIQRAAE